jgi:small subunit ribosomal protein S6
MTRLQIFMTNYELSVILSGTMAEEAVKEAGQKVIQTIKDLGGEIKSTNEPSHKRLAYAIKKIRNGIYINVYFDLAPAATKQLDKNLKLMPEVVRFQIAKPPRATIRKVRRPAIKNEVRNEEKNITHNHGEEAKKMSMEDLDKKLDEILGEEVKS